MRRSMTTISDERLAVANEEHQVFADRDWWRAAGDIIGLELTGWTFRNEAQFVDRETRQTVVLTGAVAKRLQSLRAQASPAPVSGEITDQMVEVACKVFIPHWEACTLEVRADVFGDMRTALTAALAAKGGR